MFDQLQGKKYSIIYADPPWQYRNKYLKRRGAESHYPTMNIEQIKNLPVSTICADDCFLFLWVTFPLLQEGLDVIRAWGFEYKTLGFSWFKLNKSDGRPFFGMGRYTRSNCELCLLGIRGKPIVASNSVSSVIISHRQEHSQKPVKIYSKIVQLCGDLPRIELFARQQIGGWDMWDLNLDSTHHKEKKKSILPGLF